jgi:hypothetical protein
VHRVVEPGERQLSLAHHEELGAAVDGVVAVDAAARTEHPWRGFEGPAGVGGEEVEHLHR